VSVAKQSVTVSIGGVDYTLRSEHTPEYTREMAAYLDASILRTREMLPMVDALKVTVLAALAIVDELHQARRGDREMAARLAAMADDLARLLPPPKRGSRSTGGMVAPAD
jgi:cell division protein ZapA (FtsZ GTPase activity inhibitor)